MLDRKRRFQEEEGGIRRAGSLYKPDGSFNDIVVKSNDEGEGAIHLEVVSELGQDGFKELHIAGTNG